MQLLRDTIGQIQPSDSSWRGKAHSRLEQLSMPHWALGRLMDLAEDLAGITRSLHPPVEKRVVVTMAGDHGVALEGVSKYPQEVTPQMVFNFVQGGAGINALARQAGAEVVVADLGVKGDLTALAGKILDRSIAPGTRNMAQGPAMSREEAVRALEAGIEIALSFPDVDLFGTGDMGIANTTPSAAILSVLSGCSVEEATGRGTGLDDEQLARKVEVIEKAIALNRPDPSDPLDILSKVGGFEIAGIAGLILGSASRRKPVLVDGFISTAGAMIAKALCPAAADFMILAHASAERGHQLACRYLEKQPLLDLGMRLGEGTGAALAMHLVEASVRILTEVSTFEEASVSQA